jgi:hypothetical protein
MWDPEEGWNRFIENFGYIRTQIYGIAPLKAAMLIWL